MTQPLRISQFVITYGPGAILEGPRGPCIIPSPDIGLFAGPNPITTPASLEISDQRMSVGLLGNARIFRLPSNAELGQDENRALYSTRPFPSWSLCINTNAHAGRIAILYIGRGCPVCGDNTRRRQQAIRFVSACARGHLDDVDWVYLVHRGRNCPNRQYFLWHGVGGALSQIELECPTCNAIENLGQAYGREWRCSGRLPERETINANRVGGCPEAARIVQRQASNLRLPELRTLFTIPPRSTDLHRLLQATSVRTLLVVLRQAGPVQQGTLAAMLTELVRQGLFQDASAREILRHPWPEIAAAIDDVLTPIRPGIRDLLDDEFGALLSASLNGAPPVQVGRPVAHVVFEVHQGDVQRVNGPNGRRIRVAPVSRLRTVTVQIGFRREVPRGAANAGVPPDVVRVDFLEGGERWFPGVEYLGEGLFICLDDDEAWHFPLGGPAAANWERTHQNPVGYTRAVFRSDEPDELHPVFVWWHTLSHLLLRSVSIDAGYSSSSIRERIFVQFDPRTGRARGGVILYATQPGSDGTLGGLIALAPHFQAILDRAMEMARSCSNDPLCSEQHFEPGQYNGPACYGCQLVSETSCEHRNLWLDRELLNQNLP